MEENLAILFISVKLMSNFSVCLLMRKLFSGIRDEESGYKVTK